MTPQRAANASSTRIPSFTIRMHKVSKPTDYTIENDDLRPILPQTSSPHRPDFKNSCSPPFRHDAKTHDLAFFSTLRSQDGSSWSGSRCTNPQIDMTAPQRAVVPRPKNPRTLLSGYFDDRFLLARHNASDARRRRLTLFFSLRAFGPSRPPATCKRNEPYSSKPSKMTPFERGSPHSLYDRSPPPQISDPHRRSRRSFQPKPCTIPLGSMPELCRTPNPHPPADTPME